MAGSDSADLAVAVSEAGGLGSLACALLSPELIRAEFVSIRMRTSKPINLNFFCHQPPANGAERESAWLKQLEKFYVKLGISLAAGASGPARTPFNETHCSLMEELRPNVVSFHFGLPEAGLVQRLKKAGVTILSSATSVIEARWLEDHGCDAIIAQGFEAGGHRGMFLSEDISTQTGTMSLVPQIVDSVKVPVIAAGGIADARGIVASLALGASAVQLGTAYLFCPEAKISPLYRKALTHAQEGQTVLTNVFTGRPARGIMNLFVKEVGPMSKLVPQFPAAGVAVGPLRTKSEENGSTDFMQMWSGQSASLCRSMPAAELTRALAEESGLRRPS